jgi:branched-chain amino acid transport system ATP-binding protein
MMLFKGPLLSPQGYVIDTLYIIAVMLLSYRVALTRSMVVQYPWLYERDGLFQWRAK